PKLMRLIDKWLKAGVMHHGVRMQTDEGVPQGGPVSPILANVYLHYALDLWFKRVFKPTCRGEVHLVRFADDFVVGFQYAADAQRFAQIVTSRLGKFHLELSPEKTRQLVFGRFARERLAAYGKRPETFTFLG